MQMCSGWCGRCVGWDESVKRQCSVGGTDRRQRWRNPASCFDPAETRTVGVKHGRTLVVVGS